MAEHPLPRLSTAPNYRRQEQASSVGSVRLPIAGAPSMLTWSREQATAERPISAQMVERRVVSAAVSPCPLSSPPFSGAGAVWRPDPRRSIVMAALFNTRRAVDLTAAAIPTTSIRLGRHPVACVNDTSILRVEQQMSARARVTLRCVLASSGAFERCRPA